MSDLTALYLFALCLCVAGTFFTRSRTGAWPWERDRIRHFDWVERQAREIRRRMVRGARAGKTRADIVGAEARALRELSFVVWRADLDAVGDVHPRDD